MQENRLGELSIQFCAKVSASLSHELNNVLAVFNESSGLLNDYLAIIEKGGNLNTAVLGRVAQRLNTQVEHGQEIIARMNRFAHSGDLPQAEIDLAETVELMVKLQKRLAALAGAEFFVDCPAEIKLTTNPFQLEDLLWRTLCFLSPWAKAASPCPVRLVFKGSEATITIEGLHCAGQEGNPEFPGRDESFLLELLGARMELDRKEGRLTISLGPA